MSLRVTPFLTYNLAEARTKQLFWSDLFFILLTEKKLKIWPVQNIYYPETSFMYSCSSITRCQHRAAVHFHLQHLAGAFVQSDLHEFIHLCTDGGDHHARCQPALGAILGFSVLPKDTLTCRQGESNQQPSYNMIALPLSHNRPPI